MKRLALFLANCMMLSCLSRQGDVPVASPGPVISDGLSHPGVTCFCEDASGLMWIGTERGLNRYNGYDFHQYLFSSTDSTSIPDNHIYDICMDRQGRIWVGTGDGVACYTDKDNFVRVPIQSEEKVVQQVLCDADGRIILNMQEDLCVYDSLSRSFVNTVYCFDRFYSYHSRCYLDGDGLLWVTAPMELRCFDPSDGFRNIDNWPNPHFVTASALLPDGQLWMGGRRSLSIFDTRSRRFLKMPQTVSACLSGKEVQLIMNGEPGIVIFKTSDGIFHLYDRAEDTMTESSRQGFDTRTVYIDSSGSMWTGSDDKGFRYYPGSDRSQMLESMSVVSMSPGHDGSLWLFTLHDGLFRYDPGSGTASRTSIVNLPKEDNTDFLQSNRPLVFAASNGDVWLAFLNRQRLLRGRYLDGRLVLNGEFPAFYPRVALEDGEGGVWFGTRNEYLVHMPPGGTELERIQIWPYKTTFVSCLALAGDEILIGGYDEPLTLLDIHSRKTRRVKMDGVEIGLFDPTSALTDSSGSIWIGTRQNGLLRYDIASGNLSAVPGPPSGEIFSVEQDRLGRIWASTADGLACFDPAENRFTERLPEGSVFYDRSSAALPDGSLVFGSPDGLTLVKPWEQSSKAPVPLVFEDIKVHNSPVRPGGGIIAQALSKHPDIVLKHRDNAFSLSFAVPDYSDISRIRYSYMLEGYDRDWVETGSAREVYFANVPAGRYTFRVRYRLQPDETNYQEDSLRIKVLPSPWMSPVALAIYAVIAALAAWMIVRVRKRLMRERAAALESEREKEQERQLNRMNMTFFSNISHEFRTPLTMISGPAAELSRSGRLGKEDRNLLSIVQRSVSRMLSLVNQIMDLGKLENASLALKVSRGDIAAVLRDTADIFRLNADSLGLGLELHGMEYPLNSWFDEDKLVKIISNLLSNAIKFTPSGGTVSVELDEVPGNGGPQVKITVSDTGDGIPEDQLEKIFDRYYQLDNNNKTGSYNYGTGIGLYYSRSLASIHHGSLVAGNRTDGHGAVFTLLLPASEGAYSLGERVASGNTVSGEYPMETAVSETEEAVAEEENKPLVLAVDDDPDVVRYLSALLSSSYRVISAYGGEEALKLAEDRSPDLVLSDVSMPGMNGFDLCRKLKSSLQMAHVPVILVTAMGTVQNQVHGLDVGADAYVTKPFDPDYLKALVKSQLENRLRIRGQLNAATGTSEVDTLSARDKAFMDEVYDLMEKELSNEDLDISRLTELLRISRTKLYYKIKGLTGKTPSEFFMQYKLNVAAKMLKEGKLNVSEIAAKTGFNTLPHFSKAFKKQFGVSPSHYPD